MDDRAANSSSGCVKIVGCLLVLIVLSGLCVCGGALFTGGSIAGLFGAISGMIKNSEPYTEGLARAQASPAVQQALGKPIKAGWAVSGSIRLENNEGECSITVPVSGPNGAGTLDIQGTKQGGRWTYDRLQVRVDASGETIDLQAAAADNEASP